MHIYCTTWGSSFSEARCLHLQQQFSEVHRSQTAALASISEHVGGRRDIKFFTAVRQRSTVTRQMPARLPAWTLDCCSCYMAECMHIGSCSVVFYSPFTAQENNMHVLIPGTKGTGEPHQLV